MEIFKTINNHRSSNSYFLKVSDREIVCIDVGDFDVNSFKEWMYENNFTLKAVILTHEHSDHCLGVNSLSEIMDFQLYGSKDCALNIRDPKKNYSKYLQGIETFSIHKKCTVVNDFEEMQFGKYKFTFIETPGHSPGSICIYTDGVLFSGDTIMQSHTPTQFPNSNKTEYRNSRIKINDYLEQETLIYPGHGDAFFLHEDL